MVHELYWFFGATGIKYPKMDGLKNINLFSHSSGVQVQDQVSAGLVAYESPEGSMCSSPLSLACKTAIFSLFFTLSSLHTFLCPNFLFL